MMVFKSGNARTDMSSFAASGLPTFAPFDFERLAKMPDGTEATVAFSLAFVQSPDMPRVAFFVSENRAQSYFWKPEFQSHVNGANGIVAVYLSSPAPERDAAFVSKMFGGKVSPIPEGCSVACGPAQELRVLTPQAMAARGGPIEREPPILAGVAIAAKQKRWLTPGLRKHAASHLYGPAVN
jgi:hypothetical protein